jgi:toxin CptA
LLLHGTLILLVLLAPWPDGYVFLWMALLTILVFECIRSQKKITSRQGSIAFLAADRLSWQRKEWRFDKPVWVLNSGVLLSLQEVTGKTSGQGKVRRQRFWLASDSMSPEEWRHLRQWLLNAPKAAGAREKKS